jgi:tetratricopeptide (TPR) repeat protein
MLRSLAAIPVLAVVLFFSSCGKKGAAESHYIKANDLVMNNDFDGGKAEYLKTLEEDSTNWKAYYQLANLSQLQGRFEDAMYYFDQCIRHNPQFALGYFNRSNLADFLGDDKRSNADLNTTISIKHDFYAAYLGRARKKIAAKRLNMAIADLDTAIGLRPDFYMAYSMRGSCKYQLKQFDAAIKDFDEEIAKAPRHMLGYVNRAVAEGELKHYREGINDLNAALQIDPLWTQAYLYRGVFYHSLGKKDSGCGDFRMAYKLHNPQAEAYSQQYCK